MGKNTLRNGVRDTFTKIALQAYCDTAAAKCEGEMKKNAPWKNHTGDARRTLKGRAFRNPDNENEYLIELSYGVDYGVWLEYAHEGKYAIIKPTIQKMSQEVMNGFSNLLNKIQ